jgi:hypothetical protein
MLDGVSLDQLRTFIASAEEGSFSAAGRQLRRAQSVVSQTLANLEGQIGRTHRVIAFNLASRSTLVGASSMCCDERRYLREMECPGKGKRRKNRSRGATMSGAATTCSSLKTPGVLTLPSSTCTPEVTV